MIGQKQENRNSLDDLVYINTLSSCHRDKNGTSITLHCKTTTTQYINVNSGQYSEGALKLTTQHLMMAKKPKYVINI
jgi:hypothetical protein